MVKKKENSSQSKKVIVLIASTIVMAIFFAFSIWGLPWDSKYAQEIAINVYNGSYYTKFEVEKTEYNIFENSYIVQVKAKNDPTLVKKYKVFMKDKGTLRLGYELE